MSYAWILPPICDPKVKVPNKNIKIDRVDLPAKAKSRLEIFSHAFSSVYKLDLEPNPDPHQFADDKPKKWDMSLFEYFFKGLIHYLEARISIRIRI